MFNKSQLSRDLKAAKEPRKLARPVDKTVIPGAPKVDPNGYWDPANVGRVIEVPLNEQSRSITMSYPDGTPLDQPLIGVGTDTGMTQYMMPGQDYIFPYDSSVIEKPFVMEEGGTSENIIFSPMEGGCPDGQYFDGKECKPIPKNTKIVYSQDEYDKMMKSKSEQKKLYNQYLQRERIDNLINSAIKERLGITPSKPKYFNTFEEIPRYGLSPLMSYGPSWTIPDGLQPGIPAQGEAMVPFSQWAKMLAKSSVQPIGYKGLPGGGHFYPVYDRPSNYLLGYNKPEEAVVQPTNTVAPELGVSTEATGVPAVLGAYGTPLTTGQTLGGEELITTYQYPQYLDEWANTTPEGRRIIRNAQDRLRDFRNQRELFERAKKARKAKTSEERQQIILEPVGEYSFESGGTIMDLTDEEIKQYQDAGYVVDLTPYPERNNPANAFSVKDPRSMQPGGTATAADSSMVAANARRVLDYYKGTGNYRFSPTAFIPRSYLTGQLLWTNIQNERKRLNTPSGRQELSAIRMLPTMLQVPTYKYWSLPGPDKNKVYARETASGILDIKAPMSLYDRRISPQYDTNIESIRGNVKGDAVNLTMYDPLAITPAAKLTDAEIIKRYKKFGASGIPESRLIGLGLIKKPVTSTTKPTVQPTAKTTGTTAKPSTSLKTSPPTVAPTVVTPPNWNKINMTPERMEQMKRIHGEDVFQKYNPENLVIYDLNKDLIDNTTDFTPFIDPSNTSLDKTSFAGGKNAEMIKTYMQKKGWALDTKSGNVIAIPPEILASYVEPEPVIPVLPTKPAQQMTPEEFNTKPRTSLVKKYDKKQNKWITHEIPYNEAAEQSYQNMEQWRLQNPQTRKSSHEITPEEYKKVKSKQRNGGYVNDQLTHFQDGSQVYNPMTYFDTQTPYTFRSGDVLDLDKLKLQEDVVIPYYNERTGEFRTQEGTFKPDQYEKVEVSPGVFVARFKSQYGDNRYKEFSLDNEFNKKYYKHYAKGNEYWPIYSTVPYDKLLQQWRSEETPQERNGGYINNYLTRFQDGDTVPPVVQKPEWYQEPNINPSAFVSGYRGQGEEPSTYRYGFFDSAEPGSVIAGGGLGIPKYGLEGTFTGVIPTSPEDFQYFRGNYDAGISKQLKDFNIGLGVNTSITGYPSEQGFVRDPLRFEPRISLKYNIHQDGGNTDPGNNALELHMFYDKNNFEDGGSLEYQVGEEVDEPTYLYLKSLGYEFE